jgi:hypothetical protein
MDIRNNGFHFLDLSFLTRTHEECEYSGVKKAGNRLYQYDRG